MKNSYKVTLFFVFVLIVCSASAQENFKLPKYEKFKLKNGLTVYLMEQQEVPLVYVSAVFPAGAVYDPEGKDGLASATSEALMFGTKNYTKEKLEESLDYVGASVDVGAGKEAIYLSASFAKKDQQKILAIVKDIILNPSFPASEWEKVQQRTLVELDQMKEGPRSVIGFYYDKFVFDNHVYGKASVGSKKTVQNITNQDIKQFYQEHFNPSTSAIAVVGDFDKAKMKKQLQELFKDWKGEAKSARLELAELPVQKKARVLLVNKPDALETTFLIGGPGVSRNNPDYVAIQVINTILGGRFTSWLNDELRVNSGLTYGAHSFFDLYKKGGSFLISTFTENASTEQAIDLALEVNKRLHEKKIDQATLESAKNYVKGQFPPKYETGESIANLLSSMFLYDFDESYINTFNQKVDELDVEKANAIISKYFPKENLQFVLLGKADEIREVAKKYGEVTEKEISEDGF